MEGGEFVGEEVQPGGGKSWKYFFALLGLVTAGELLNVDK